jgi:hypothetical protein
VGPRIGLGAVAKRKIPCHYRESNPIRPARSLVTILTDIYIYIYIYTASNYMLKVS